MSSLEALLEKQDRDFSTHLARDYADQAAGDNALGFLYFKFSRKVDEPKEENKEVIQALCREDLLSMKFFDDGYNFLAFYSLSNGNFVHKNIDDKAMEIRRELEKNQTPIIASASFVANSGDLNAVKAYADELAAISEKEKRHHHGFPKEASK